MTHQAHDNKVPLKREDIYSFTNQSCLDEKLGKMIPSPERPQTPSLKGSTISSATILSSLRVPLAEKKERTVDFYEPEKKIKQEKRKKGKRQRKKKSMVQIEPNNENSDEENKRL